MIVVPGPGYRVPEDLRPGPIYRVCGSARIEAATKQEIAKLEDEYRAVMAVVPRSSYGDLPATIGGENIRKIGAA